MGFGFNPDPFVIWLFDHKRFGRTLHRDVDEPSRARLSSILNQLSEVDLSQASQAQLNPTMSPLFQARAKL